MVLEISLEISGLVTRKFEFYIDSDALAVAIRKHTPLSKPRDMLKVTKRAKPAAIAVSSMAVARFARSQGS